MRYLLIFFQKINSDNHLKEMLKGSSYVLVFRFLGVFSGYLFFLTISRNFGAEAVGVFNLSFSILSVCLIIGRLGLENAIVRFIADAVEKNNAGLGVYILNKCLMLVVCVGLLLSFLYFVGSTTLANFFDNDKLIVPFKIMALIIVPFLFIMINSHGLRGYRFLKEFSLFQNGNFQLLATIFILFGLIFCEGNLLPEYAYAAAILFGLLPSVYYYFRRILVFKTLDEQSFQLKSILQVSMPMLVTGSMFTLMNWTDTVILGYYMQENEVGIYNISNKISLLISIALFAINAMAGTQFADFYAANKKEELHKLAKQTSLVNAIFALPAFVVVITFPVWLLSFFGNEFIVGKISLCVLAFGQFSNAVCGSVINFLNMTGKEKVVRNIIVFSVFVNIVLNILLIPELGILGAAIATSFSMVLWNVCGVIYVRYNYGFWMLPIR